MQAQLGDEYDAFFAALQEKPKISLRYNPNKSGANFPTATPVPWCDGGYYLPERPAFFKDPHIYAGSYYVQEASSMLIAQMGDFAQDIRVLDLCAAPGGKSTLLASRLTEGSLLVSNEIVRNRAEVLEENISRWGSANVIVTHNHPKSFGNLRNFFDLIVIDAPCSGEGMFRKDPKVMQHWSPKMVQHCAQRQKDILNAVMDSLKPGGRLIYSTCTYNPTENEDIIHWLLHSESDMYRILPVELPAAWGLTPGTTEDRHPDLRYTYHCYPHKVAGEGFYLACVEKLRSSVQRMESPRARARHAARRGPNQASALPLNRGDREVVQRYIATPDDYAFYDIEGFAYAVPRAVAGDYESLAGELNMLKAGIRIGEIKGGKLIPDHDLALAEITGEKVPVIPLDHEQSMRYLSRDELHMETGELRDWAIVAFEGRHLGWVKVLDNRVNNHLPKQLKIRTSLDYSEFE